MVHRKRNERSVARSGIGFFLLLSSLSFVNVAQATILEVNLIFEGAAGTTAIWQQTGTTSSDFEIEFIGFKNVNVNGSLYDVEFQNGSCIELFDGCDQQEDLDFSSISDARAAADALRVALISSNDGAAEIVLDDLSFAFPWSWTAQDYNRACNTATSFQPCYNYLIPDLLESIEFEGETFYLFGITALDMLNVRIGGASLYRYDDTSEFGVGDHIYTLWTPAATAVPAPQTLALLICGLAALVRSSRRRKALR